MSFLLDKYYVDAIDHNGEGVILYDAFVHWKWIRMRYFNEIRIDQHRGITQSHIALRKRVKVKLNGNKVEATSPFTSISLQPNRPPVKLVLHEDELGKIEWNCFAPMGEGELNDRTSLGYAEQLVMTLAPWKMKMDELYWGRFCSKAKSVVWIEWRGEWNKQWLIVDGQLQSEFLLTDDELSTSVFKLDLSHKTVLRSGSILTSVMNRFRWIRHLFPGKTLFSNETKWISAAKWGSGEEIHEGFAIFEKVIWTK